MSRLTIDHEEAVDTLLMVLVEKFEKHEFDLPPLPQVASQVLALTSDPEANASHLATVIQQDPILTAKVFQTSNSAMYGSARKITSLQQAIAWLGLNTIAGTAFTLSLQSGVFKVQGYKHEMQNLWRYMLTTACYAKIIADLIGRSPDANYLAGLLHAVGKLFVVHTVNLHQQDSPSPLPWTAMLTLIQESYVEAGRQLAEAWGFPDHVREAINLHEDHTFHLATSSTNSAAITCLANHFASHFLVPGALPEEALRELPVVQALKIQEDVIEALLEHYPSIQTQVESRLI